MRGLLYNFPSIYEDTEEVLLMTCEGGVLEQEMKLRRRKM